MTWVFLAALAVFVSGTVIRAQRRERRRRIDGKRPKAHFV